MIDSVLLVAFGGPTSIEEVRPFLDNVLRGRRASPERIETVFHHYELLGGKSPFNELTLRQAQALEATLASAGTPLPVFVGMRNWHPYLHDTLAAMTAAGAKHAVAVIMAAQQCDAGWFRYQREVEAARAEIGPSAPRITYAQEWHAHPLFLEASRHNVSRALAAATGGHIPTRVDRTTLIFTAHSIPLAMANESPYVEQLTEAAEKIAEAIEHDDWVLAYQSRSGDPREPWLAPDVCDVIRTLAADGVRRVVVAPIGFVCDHVEVLYDLDIEARQVAQQVGVELTRAATVNDHPAFISMLADIVRRSPGDA